MNDQDELTDYESDIKEYTDFIHAGIDYRIEQIIALARADERRAVIAHLWQRADDWETVQRPIAAMLEGEVKCDVHPESYHHKLEDMAAQITATIMTALLGPKPNEQDTER